MNIKDKLALRIALTTIIIVFAIIAVLFGYRYFYIERHFTHNRYNNDFIEKVDKEYFKNNFKFISMTEYSQRKNPSHRGDPFDSYKYKFLPFSFEDFEYFTYISINKITGDTDYSGAPPCVFDENPNRCDFSIKYAEVHKTGKERLPGETFNVRLLKNDDGLYIWAVSNIESSFRRTYFVNANDGTETEVEEVRLR